MEALEKAGGAIIQGRWRCQECYNFILDGLSHNEDCQCDTPGCECPECDYHGSNFDGE